MTSGQPSGTGSQSRHKSDEAHERTKTHKGKRRHTQGKQRDIRKAKRDKDTQRE
ncbi:hypothetical protein HMPREF9137_1866 [Prevotella denticola F0289]|nr:hypothetical protein HMPREF9137_1866 [Prevotella denticola F0289]